MGMKLASVSGDANSGREFEIRITDSGKELEIVHVTPTEDFHYITFPTPTAAADMGKALVQAAIRWKSLQEGS